ncbi:hypothetical protein J6590_034205 [Homalodisca vitripennis]|nr:hypothetical protein J6590_034205 [Homalodisca vitripennis]
MDQEDPNRISYEKNCLILTESVEERIYDPTFSVPRGNPDEDKSHQHTFKRKSRLFRRTVRQVGTKTGGQSRRSAPVWEGTLMIASRRGFSVPQL